jgi:hypothetical protein
LVQNCLPESKKQAVHCQAGEDRKKGDERYKITRVKEDNKQEFVVRNPEPLVSGHFLTGSHDIHFHIIWCSGAICCFHIMGTHPMLQVGAYFTPGKENKLEVFPASS